MKAGYSAGGFQTIKELIIHTGTKPKNMKSKFYLFIILTMFGVKFESLAQVSFLKKSMGNLGSLPKVGDLQNNASLDNVDMSTGTLKVGIPLYEIKVNDISVPISLNYSALGLKVNQEAGPVGMGWDLSVGGKISSNVNGRQDDDYYGMNGPGINLQNFSAGDQMDTYNNLSHYQKVKGVLDGTLDGAWDTYNYSFPGGGGTYTQNGLTFPYDPLISIDNPGKRIKTTDGVIYQFGGGAKKIISKKKYYDNLGYNPNYISGGRWVADPPVFDYDLSYIYSSKYQDTVKFNYRTFDYDNPNDRPTVTAKTRSSKSESIPFYRDVQASSSGQGIAYSYEDQFYEIKEPMVSESRTEVKRYTRLTDITFPNGKVVFGYNPVDVLSRDQLDTVSIYKNVDNIFTLVKRYIFIYDQIKTYGHYLRAIDVYDANETRQDKWVFNYSGNFLPIVPSVPSFAQDRWGFYNNNISNKTLLEHPDYCLALKDRNHYPIVNDTYNTSSKNIRYTRPENIELYGTANPVNTGMETPVIYYTVDFANRNFSFPSAVKGTLISVQTPTGGTYEYQYEAHRIRYPFYQSLSNSYNWVNEEGGGIRIKSITKRLGHDSLYYGMPNAEKSTTKTYEYGIANFDNAGNGEESAGYGEVSIPGNVLGMEASYSASGGSIVTLNNMMLLSHPANNMVQYGGSFAMYRSVSEILLKSEIGTDNFGKTIYFSNVNEYGSLPDQKWRETGFSLTDPKLPIIDINPGVKLESIVGIRGYKKYEYDSGLSQFKMVEGARYYFTSFLAPQTNKLMSFFGGVNGQVSGSYPSQYSTPTITDSTYPENRGGYIVNLFNSLKPGSGGGNLDFITRCLMGLEGDNVNYPGKYYTQLIDLNQFSNCIKKVSEDRFENANGQTIHYNLQTKYYYDNIAHLLTTKIASKSSKGDSTFTRMKYPLDYLNPSSGSAIEYMKANKLGLDQPIEEYSTRYSGTTPGVEYVKSGSLNTFRIMNNAIYPEKAYSLKVGNTSLVYGAGTSYDGSSTSIDSNKYKLQVSYDLYVKGNLHKYTETAAPGNVIIWGYKNQHPIAKVSNANNISNSISADVCYTSFETGDVANWAYSGIPIAVDDGVSGKKAYNLSTGSISKINPTISGIYIVSYWYKTGAVISISGGTVSAAQIKRKYGEWTLAEHEISGNITNVTVAGSGLIDELRFHPAAAQMTTYTYEPLVGVTGSIDHKGVASYYLYDDSQRLRHIKDQQGNIVKSYKYILGSANY